MIILFISVKNLFRHPFVNMVHDMGHTIQPANGMPYASKFESLITSIHSKVCYTAPYHLVWGISYYTDTVPVRQATCTNIAVPYWTIDQHYNMMVLV